MRFVKENKELVITRVDKGNATVILTRKDYDEKMHHLLDDTPT